MAHIHYNPEEIRALCCKLRAQAEELNGMACELTHTAYGIASITGGSMETDKLAEQCRDQLEAIEKLRKECAEKSREIQNYMEEMMRLIPPTIIFP